jgi:predicted nucleic acid-binding protein
LIVVDTNVLVHYWLETAEYDAARALLDIDANWYAPYLWRSEFRNALAIHMRHAGLAPETARKTNRGAEQQMYDHEYFVDPTAVLDLVAASTCSAYDCEFVALATELRIPLVTTDKQILRDFPRIARPLGDYR